MSAIQEDLAFLFLWLRSARGLKWFQCLRQHENEAAHEAAAERIQKHPWHREMEKGDTPADTPPEEIPTLPIAWLDLANRLSECNPRLESADDTQPYQVLSLSQKNAETMPQHLARLMQEQRMITTRTCMQAVETYRKEHGGAFPQLLIVHPATTEWMDSHLRDAIAREDIAVKWDANIPEGTFACLSTYDVQYSRIA